MSLELSSLDHLVLYATDVDATAAFYEQLGMERRVFDGGRVALEFGDHKLNLHRAGEEYVPHAQNPTPGGADFCLITTTDPETMVETVEATGIEIVEGPVEKTGANGPMTSVYVRDPDGNLVEVAVYH